MNDPDADGWRASAAAWVRDMGPAEGGGDYGRRHILDAPMLARATRRQRTRALDVGCGEGRFCRMLAARGIPAIGIDPTPELIDEAIARDPAGDYRLGTAEALDCPDDSFDLVVSYLTLIDIPDAERAIAEMARVLAPGGSLLIANLSGLATANAGQSWLEDKAGTARFPIDNYLSAWPYRASWRGIDIVNWHRPLSLYMRACLAAGLTLVHYDEPAPDADGPADRAARYRRAPWFVTMEWDAPG
ncbi:class I SAM-dependent methyltransferase [Acuticoccus sp. M5D2P5]|uniref:class I SAM-dependent methyltransferase n=1 Tax=Acuticoccus kalidii TaxID=2910977 RepID=UPI001F2D2B70|nr:class I SAM-dependent methyltransferase [Acuticoccus kalidii]MCF3932090.1 class I SAM-dependent methyltransferase [Acuticoccus kalidii]